MAVKTPSELSKGFEKNYNARDLKGLMSLYTDGAILTMDGKTKIAGKPEIEKVMATMVATPGNRCVCTCVDCHEAGDTALVRTDWQMFDAKGAVINSGLSAEVAKRGPDGLWRFIIDDATYVSRSR